MRLTEWMSNLFPAGRDYRPVKDKLMNTTEREILREWENETSSRWWVHYPAAAYSYNIDFDVPVAVNQAIEDCLNWLRVDELPKGTEIYK